ncbi:hypothetical protein E6O75_ATG04317 [Venturia nashicola]|uniref:Uncharacterized protein n=1 Tax=Venturia nashicola TaxID=86259 RepID=A0A4Z1PQC3_9PEZI|nr:hypothetical protein E6O75_ATG04317 [Venturia nashicola]
MFTPAYLQRIISTSKNELEIMAPRHRIRERVPAVKAMARLALAGSWPKPKRVHSDMAPINVPAFGPSQTLEKKVKDQCKFCSPRNRIMDTFSRFAHMTLQRRVGENNAVKNTSQSGSGASSPAMSLHRRDTESTAATGQEQDSAGTRISTPSTTRVPSSESDHEVIPTCLTPKGRHAKSYGIKVPANSLSSDISGRTDETPHCPRKWPYSRCQSIISKRTGLKKPNTALENLTRLEREIKAYHKSLGRGNQDSAQTLLNKYGINISLFSLQPTERVHLVSCIYRRAYDCEVSLLPLDSKSKYPPFFPLWKIIDDFDWKYYDHDGNIRPEAYVAMAEQTGEEGLFTRKELEKVRMEGFRDARFEMGEGWWGEVEGWVQRVVVSVEMGKELGTGRANWILF